MMSTLHIGIDIGSTTIKTVVLDDENNVVFDSYERHNAIIQQKINKCLLEIKEKTKCINATINITGSVGMGIAETCHLSFVQEVVAATKYISTCFPEVSTMIDIGGEDAKVVMFKNGKADNLRMNGNCAGGTGAFIDQMAILLGVSNETLNSLSMKSTNIYPIASRCGVFCKTDIQNLIAKNVCKEDIAASIFHAVAVQTVVTLAHGCTLQPPLLFIGGPLTFLSGLRKAFVDYMNLKDDDVILPAKSHVIPAFGAALSYDEDSKVYRFDDLIDAMDNLKYNKQSMKDCLTPIFKSKEDYDKWKEEKDCFRFKQASWHESEQEIILGIDSGSTTTKIVAVNRDLGMLYSFYDINNGNPILTVKRGLEGLLDESIKHNCKLVVVGSCSTGYGENLIRAAFHLDCDIIETMAHSIAARQIVPDVSFILDIGGQDMKAIFIDNGNINRIEINEACSSGCGSFIGTFAKSLGYSVRDFASMACLSKQPCDLGTRCTVFMNSKVKQVLREGATIADISAGLSYSVIKNCLYKVLKLKSIDSLGKHIVVQGGTMRNDSIVGAFEKITGVKVFRSDRPELMGALGCALYVNADADCNKQRLCIEDMIKSSQFDTKQLHCHGCENNCTVNKYIFAGGNKYYSGNRCEKVFTNSGAEHVAGVDVYAEKLNLLFNREHNIESPILTIGIPRVLNMFEEYPFWHTLFTECGINVVLSEPSTYSKYEVGARQVMSDNICFPAKLVHSHIMDLAAKHVDRIFMPFVVFEPTNSKDNSYNCPIVTGYSQVIKGVEGINTPIDSPVISFKEKKTLYKECREYMSGLGIDDRKIKSGFKKACDEQDKYAQNLYNQCNNVLDKSKADKTRVVLLAGRPYHTDPLIQHKLSNIIASMGVNVITDDIVRYDKNNVDDVHFISQWAYPNRILKAAKWSALCDTDIIFMQMTSFGCGPDAFLVDEVRDMLHRYGKTVTLLKIDDVNNVGSLKLRVRSALDSIKYNDKNDDDNNHVSPFITTPIYTKQFRSRKILVPFFTPFISPLIPEVMKLAGYDVDTLPMSNKKSDDYGLRYANNEVCYPATLIVGDIIQAFKEKKYDPDLTSVMITQTGGQCRASNYISLIKKALVEAGYTNTPVISLSFGSGMKNNQPGFEVNWLKIMPMIVAVVLFSDSMSKLYYATLPREKKANEANRILDKYMNEAKRVISTNQHKDLYKLISEAANEFNSVCKDKDCSKVGIVGEIFLKFNPFAQHNITSWLINRKIEVLPPLLIDFFMQSFVNTIEDKKNYINNSLLPQFIINKLYNAVKKNIDKIDELCKTFKYYIPFHNIYEEANEAKKVITLEAQFGEGWLLPAEIISFLKQNVTHVVSLQPFGCIANHIVSKGITNRIKKLYPELNLLSLDFDSGVSDVNIVNRMLLFVSDLK